METIISFHDDLMFYLIFITLFVLFMLSRTVMIFKKDSSFVNRVFFEEYYDSLTHHVGLEVV
jgi:hypothetical protein